jgi:hypothetical protein
MRGFAVLATLMMPALLISCEKTQADGDRTAEDARAIAMVEAAQDVKAPPVPIEPQPITAADIEANRLYGAGCTLVPSSQPGGDPLVVADERRALVKIGGRIITFAADIGSEPLMLGVRTHYVGKAQSLHLQRAKGDGNRLGEDSVRWDGTLTMRDANEQLVYTSTGEIVCGGS